VQMQIVSKFYDCLAPGGFLFVGHSETLFGLNSEFKLVSPTVYTKQI
jgi:chemotaxis protein methyltransferase CheR